MSLHEYGNKTAAYCPMTWQCLTSWSRTGGLVESRTVGLEESRTIGLVESRTGVSATSYYNRVVSVVEVGIKWLSARRSWHSISRGELLELQLLSRDCRLLPDWWRPGDVTRWALTWFPGGRSCAVIGAAGSTHSILGWSARVALNAINIPIFG